MQAFRTWQVICVSLISGAASLYEVLGDRAAKLWIGHALAALNREARQRGGRAVLEQRDGLVLAFEDPALALEAAAAMQQAVGRVQPPFEDMPALEAQTGVNCGEVILDDESAYGDTVNAAVGVAALAKAGQVLVTGLVVEALDQALDQAPKALRFLTRTALEGRRQQVDLYELVWDASDLTSVGIPAPIGETAPGRLEMRLGGQLVVLDEGRRMITLGRHPDNDFVLEGELVSRRHAHVKASRGRFVLVDQSTNGTWVHGPDGKRSRIKMDELPLAGQGGITLGQPQADEAHTVLFEVLV